jgi:outer membrane protein OmpA-like peptidoglycan-associated protein
MRAAVILFGLLTLGACATSRPPDSTFAIFFTDNSATLDPSAQAIVVRAAATAKQFPNLPVKVAGYADRNGTPDATVQLSKARADSVSALLVANGVPPATIKRTAVGTPPNSQPGVESRRVEIDLGDN